jgi:hypothetical protein
MKGMKKNQMDFRMGKIIIGWLLCLVTVYTSGQDVCRYYYNDEKICVEVSATKMLVKSKNVNDVAGVQNAIKNTGVGNLKNIADLGYGLFLVEMENTGRGDMWALQRQLRSREDVIYTSPVFGDHHGSGYTNEVIVMLKSKDDYPVLQQCAEAYSIKDIKLNDFNDRIYIMTLPHNAQKDAMQTALELHETRLFEFAEPNLITLFPYANQNTYIPDQRELQKKGSPFTAYPNPANDVLYIDIDRQAIPSGYSTANPACKLNMYNLHGGKVFQTATNSGNKVKINVSVLQNGIYFLHLYDVSSGKQETKKILIKHE